MSVLPLSTTQSSSETRSNRSCAPTVHSLSQALDGLFDGRHAVLDRSLDASKKPWRELLSLLVVCMCAMALWGCAPPELALHLYGPGLEDKAAIKTVKWRAFGANGAPLTSSSGSESPAVSLAEKLAVLSCPPSAQAQKEALGSLFAPFFQLEVETAGGMLTGRFPLALACEGREASIFLSAPESLSPWSPRARGPGLEEALARVGHQVTLLPDGRYLITGGVRRVAFPAGASLFAPQDFVDSVLIYDPASSDLQAVKGLQLRVAFHSATVVGQQLLLIGGLQGDGAGKIEVAGVQILNIAKDGAISAGQPDASLAQGDQANYKRFLHHTLVWAPDTNAAQRVILPFGGLCSTDPSTCSGLQLILHSATYLEKHQSLVLLGGLIYEAASKRLKANPFGWELKLADLKAGQVKLSPPFQMQQPRAAHAAVPFDAQEQQLLIVGGFAVGNGANAPLRANYIHPTAEVLQRVADGDWQSKPVVFGGQTQGDFARRAFVQGTRLRDGRVLLTGGASALARSSQQGLTLQPNALLLSPWALPELPQHVGKVGACVKQLPLHTPRFWHHALTLQTGEVLLLGGLSQTSDDKGIQATPQAEIFNPSQNTNPNPTCP